MRELKKLFGKYELQELLDGIQVAADQYLIYDKQGKPTKESVETAWSKVRGVCHTRRLEKKKPYIRDLYYIRAVLRNRGYVNEQYIMDLLEAAVNAGLDIDWLKDCAKRSSSWTRFKEQVEESIDSQEQG